MSDPKREHHSLCNYRRDMACDCVLRDLEYAQLELATMRKAYRLAENAARACSEESQRRFDEWEKEAARNVILKEELAKVKRGASRLRCKEHEMDASWAWGCPGCVASLRDENKLLREALEDAKTGIEICDWRCQRCDYDPDMKTTDLAVVIYGALAKLSATDEKEKETTKET